MGRMEHEGEHEICIGCGSVDVAMIWRKAITTFYERYCFQKDASFIFTPYLV